MRLKARVPLTLLCALLLTQSAAGTVRAAEVRVAVAANFKATLQVLIPLFKRETGHRVRPSSGSTGKLYAQISNGAPFDVLLSADAARPDRLIREGIAVADSRLVYAVGRLVLASNAPASRDRDCRNWLIDGPSGKIAIANPRTAPYGLAALQTLQALGLEDAVQPRLVFGENIAQTHAFVDTGNAVAGFVALSQLNIRPMMGCNWVVPEDHHDPIEQVGVLLTTAARKKSAQDFIGFLKGPLARATIERFGYGLQ